MHLNRSSTGNTSGLIRGLGWWASTAVVVGAMVGQSVFLVTSDMSRDAGSMPRVLFAWIAGGIVVLFGSFCYAELGAAMPAAGGDYIYLSRGIGPLWGFLFGWASTMVLRPASAALIAAGLLRFVGFVWPSVLAPIFSWTLRIPFHGEGLQFSFTLAQPLAAAVVTMVAFLNYVGVRSAGRFQVLLTALKIATLTAIVILGLAVRGPAATNPDMTTPPAPYPFTSFLTILVPVMAAYNGYQWLGNAGGEVINPKKNLPRAAIAGVSLVIGLYSAVN